MGVKNAGYRSAVLLGGNGVYPETLALFGHRAKCGNLW